MFQETFYNTVFTSEKANLYFSNHIFQNDCYCDIPFEEDRTLESTLRALLYDKVPYSEKLEIRVHGESIIWNSDESEFLEKYFDARKKYLNEYESSWFQVIMLNNNINNNMFTEDQMVQMLDKIYEPIGFHKVNKVTELFKKNFNVYCYINEERKSVECIFPQSNISIKNWHYFQCAIVGMMPWYFDGSIDEDRMALLYSLRNKSSEEYLRALNKIASKINFKEQFIKTKLAGFENIFQKKEIERITRKINDMQCYIEDASTKISGWLVDIRKSQAMLIGLEEQMNEKSDDSEIMNYFLTNKHLELVSVTGNSMFFITHDYLTFFDEDMAERYIDNKHSYFYHDSKSEQEIEDRKRLFTAIFIDKKIKVKFCAAYSLDLGNLSMSPMMGHSYGSEYVEYMPNPHIDQYHCIGNFAQIFNKLLVNGDYLGCIEQAIVSGKSLNLSDGTVMSGFVDVLTRKKSVPNAPSAWKCLELPDGTVCGMKEAVEWLKKGE